MNKTQLIDAVAAKANLTKADAKKAVDATLETIAQTLKNDKIQLVGFGTFSVSERAARTGRNPLTGKEITIAAKKLVKFKAGSEFENQIQ